MAKVINIASFFKTDSAEKNFKDLETTVDNLVKKFSAVIETSKNVNKSLQDQTATQSKTNKAISDTNKNLDVLAQAEKEQVKLQEQTIKIVSKARSERTEENKTLVKAKLARQEQNKRIAEAIKLEKTEQGSIARLTAENKRLIKERNSLSTSTDKGRKRIQEINRELNKNNTLIKQNSSELEKQKSNVGNYRSALGGIRKVLGSLGLALGAGALAVKAFNSTISATQSLGDRFAITMEGMRTGSQQFFKILASGDFSNFVDRMKEAIRAGREYAEIMDDLGDRARSLRIAEADVRLERQELLKVLRDEMSTNEQRIAAADKIIEIEDRLGNQRLENAKIAYQAEVDRLTALIGINQQELENFLREYSNNSDRIAQAKEYIETQERVEFLEKEKRRSLMSGNILLGEYNQKIAEGQEKLGAFTQDTIDFAKIYQGYLKSNDEGLDQVVGAYEELRGAESSALEASQRVFSRRAVLLEENRVKTQAQAKTEERLTEKTVAEFGKRTQAYIENLAKQELTYDDYVNFTLAEVDALVEGEIEKDQNYFEQWKDLHQQRQDLEREGFEERQEIREQERDLGIQIAQQGFEFAMTLQDRQLANLEAQKNYELSLVGDNEKRKQAIEEQFAQKANEIKRKQANTEKALGIFSAGVNTALGVTKALANPGGPAGIVLAILVGLLGAAQIATIAAKPIPQFAKGLKKGELKQGVIGEYGEKGREIINMPGHRPFIAEKPTVGYIPAGTEIIPNYETEQIINQSGGISDARFNELIEEERATRKALSSQIHHSTIVTEKGFQYQTKKGNTTIKWANKYLHRN